MNAISAHVAAARHKVTVEEARRMRVQRIFGDRDFELIDGRILLLADDGGPTIEWNAAVNAWLTPALLGRGLVVVPDETLRLSNHDAPKPDFYVYPDTLRAADVRGPDAALVIEVSDTSLKDDLGWKAELYAQGGVREYWVIDVNDRRVFVHELGADGYGPPRIVAADEPVAPRAAPDVALRLSALPYVT